MPIEPGDYDQRHLDAIADAEQSPYWYDDVDMPDTNPTLVRTEHCDLCVIGGGYTGLWTAIIAKQRNPDTDVVLIEMDSIGSGASGRNGGFVSSTLTHGIANAQARWPDEVELLERLGDQNLDEIERAIGRYAIDCDYERVGELLVGTIDDADGYLDELHDDYEELLKYGHDVVWFDAEAMQAEIHSSTYTGGMWDRRGCALVDPARLVWGLKAAAESLGVRIYEDTEATGLEREGPGVLVTTPLGKVVAGQVALGTNAFPPLVRRLKYYIAPVYDYCMATQPLTPEQLRSLGWEQRQGLSDIANQFHYYRLTDDNRIVWGGYDAVYFFGGKVEADREYSPEIWAKLSAHFFRTFPQLEGLEFSHIWGGVIDTSSRYCAFQGRAMGGRVAYSLGYTGMGAGASRFGAEVMVDLLTGRNSVATRTEFVRSKPIPFPPEPFKYLGIQATKAAMAREDRTGKRNLWLRSLDRLGLGFDS